jgi:hypothetical protein
MRDDLTVGLIGFAGSFRDGKSNDFNAVYDQ